MFCVFPITAMASLVEGSTFENRFIFLDDGAFLWQRMVRHAASEKKAAVAIYQVGRCDWMDLGDPACPLLILEFGEQWHLSSKAIMFSAIFSSTVIMWAFSLVDDYIPSLFVLLVILVTGLVPAG